MARDRSFRFYLMTLGCPKNSVDSEAVSALLVAAGLQAVERPARADLILVNTCGFIEPAREQSLSALRDLVRYKRPAQKLAAIGCLAERWGARMLQEAPGLDGVLGTRRWMQAALFAHALWAEEPRPVWVGDPPGAPRPGHDHDSQFWSEDAPTRRSVGGASAFLKIADGCSAPCAFCAIPAIKGPARSRPAEAIVAEAAHMGQAGVRELVLIAQDTTAYGHDRGEKDALPGLIERILRAASELRWLRLMYAYPQHITDRLIETMAGNPEVAHYLDMPIQHAHPDVLRRMKRSPDVEGVRRRIDALRDAMPDIAIRTSLIVGYPGETDDEFEALLGFLGDVRFDRVGAFAFSAEEGTVAAGLPGQLPPTLIQERYQRAMEVQKDISLARNREQVGRTLQVLVEGSEQGLCVGRSYRDAPEIDGLVLAPGRLRVGEWAQMRITGALPYDLEAEVVYPGGRPSAPAPRRPRRQRSR